MKIREKRRPPPCRRGFLSVVIPARNIEAAISFPQFGLAGPFRDVDDAA